MTIIMSPRELKAGVWYEMFAVKDIAEAEKIAGDKTALLYKSHIIESYFLWVEADDVRTLPR